jgi:hypothetical protein
MPQTPSQWIAVCSTPKQRLAMPVGIQRDSASAGD